jgi:hypothetical protein
MAPGSSSCSKESDSIQIPKESPSNVPQFVEDAAIEYAMRGTELLPEELKVKWAERNEDHWLAEISLVPEVPSG